jgi:UDP-glucose 4-epimerase
VEILYRSVMGDHAGTYNVAGPGILYLSQAIRMAGSPTVPVPPAARAAPPACCAARPDRLLPRPAAAPAVRPGRRHLADAPRLRLRAGFSTRTAFEDFLGNRRIEPLVDRATAERWERELNALLLRAARLSPAGRSSAARRRPMTRTRPGGRR